MGQPCRLAQSPWYAASELNEVKTFSAASLLAILVLLALPISSSYATEVTGQYGTISIPSSPPNINYSAPSATPPCGNSLTSFSYESILGTGASLLNGKHSTATSSLTGMVSLNSSCPEVLVGKTKMPECEAFGADTLEKILKGNKAAVSSLACRIGQTQALNNELSCFSEMINSGKKELLKLQQAITPELLRATKTIAQLDADIGDRGEQLKEVEQRSKEMALIQENLRKAVYGNGEAKGTGFSGIVAKQGVQAFRIRQTQFKTAQTQYQNGLAMNCFLKEPKAGLKCTSGGTDVSPSEYIQCSAVAATQRDSNGNIIQNTALRTKTQNSLKTEFERLEQNAIVTADFPDTAATIANQKKQMKDPAAVEKYFTSRFASMRALKAGVTMDGAIRSEMSRCSTKAAAQVKTEMADSSATTSISQSALKIKNDGEELQRGFGAGITASAEVYREALVKVTGNPDLKLNTEPCKTAALESQASCAQQLDTLLRSLLEGKISQTDSSAISPEAARLSGGAAPVTAFSRNIIAPSETASGANKRLSFQMKCVGVNACVTAYQNAYEQVGKDITSMNAGKIKFTKMVNAAIQDKTEQVAKILGPQADFIQKRQRDLSLLLGKLGVKGGLNLEADEGNPDVNPGESPYKNGDIESLIKGKIKPALFKSDAGIQAAREGLADRSKDMKDQLSEYLEVLEGANAKYISCQSKALAAVDELLNKTNTDCRADKKETRLCSAQATKVGTDCVDEAKRDCRISFPIPAESPTSSTTPIAKGTNTPQQEALANQKKCEENANATVANGGQNCKGKGEIALAECGLESVNDNSALKTGTASSSPNCDRISDLQKKSDDLSAGIKALKASTASGL